MGFIIWRKCIIRLIRKLYSKYILRLFDVGDKILNGIKTMYVDSSSLYQSKGGENERFRIASRVRQGCIMSP